MSGKNINFEDKKFLQKKKKLFKIDDIDIIKY